MLYQPNSTTTRKVDITVDETSWTLLWNSPTYEALYQVIDALTMKYRGGWPRLVHLSADYARDSGTTTMRPCGLKARYTVQSCWPQTTDEKAACLHDATWVNWQTRKYSNGQKESPVDWTCREDVNKQATKAGSLPSTVFWSQKERAPSSPVQGYHQEKPEAGRHKDRPMDIILTAER